MRAILRLAALCVALMCGIVSHASAQVIDQFKQMISPEANAAVDAAKALRLPYNKTPEQARGDALLAVKMLESIVIANPDYYRALFNLGLAYDQAGDFAKADETFKTAIALRSKLGVHDISLLNSAGWVSMQHGDYAAAEERFKLALADIGKGEPFTQSAVYNNLGLLYFYTQRFKEAEEYLLVARDKYGSKSAANTLDLIAKTNEIIESQQSLEK